MLRTEIATLDELLDAYAAELGSDGASPGPPRRDVCNGMGEGPGIRPLPAGCRIIRSRS